MPKFIDDNSFQKIHELMNETSFMSKIVAGDDQVVLDVGEREGLSLFFNRMTETLCDISLSIQDEK